MSVLRAFRLMRVFKLVRFLPSLQAQISVIAKSVTQMLAFFGLLALFLFTSAILGMHLFGAKLVQDNGESVRHNFDDLLWSLITVFQVNALKLKTTDFQPNPNPQKSYVVKS